MAREELSCSACETRFPSQAFCPSCGVPSTIATSEERILWEMGQWEGETAQQQPTMIKLASVAPEPAHEGDSSQVDPRVESAPSSPAAPRKSFSPVPMPRKGAPAAPSGRQPAAPRVEPVKPNAPAARTDATKPTLIHATDGAAALEAQPVAPPEPSPTGSTPEVPAPPAAQPTPAPPRMKSGSIVRRPSEGHGSDREACCGPSRATPR